MPHHVHGGVQAVDGTDKGSDQHERTVAQGTAVDVPGHPRAPAFYTIWNYRFNIVRHMMAESDDTTSYLNKELDWLDEVTLNNPKNYQICPIDNRS